MFGKLIRDFRKVRLIAEVHRLLEKNYHLAADIGGVTNYVNYAVEFNSSNPHELAIGYLVEQVEGMDQKNPQHIKSATRYIQVAKQACETGAASRNGAFKELDNATRKHLGLNPDAIRAVPY